MANLTIEQIKKIGQEKLGHEITDEEAKRYLEGGELSENELMAVTGGGCGDDDNDPSTWDPDNYCCERFENKNPAPNAKHCCLNCYEYESLPGDLRPSCLHRR